MKLKISGTSFLLPNNDYWKILSEHFELNFSEPGKWDMSFLNSNEDDFLIEIISFKDLINPLQKQSKNLIILRNFFNLLNKRLKICNKPTVVLYSMYDVNNLLKVSKKITENY